MAELFLARGGRCARLRKDAWSSSDSCRTSLREPSYTAMFIDEAKLTARLIHPKIAQTFELGTGEQTALHRHGVHRWHRCIGASARVRSQASAGAGRTRGLHNQGGARRARLRAPAGRCRWRAAGHRPPRHLAVERPAVAARRREAGRLRHRARDRARPASPHQERHAQGQVRLHVPRAGAGAAGRRALRSVLDRDRPGRAALWSPLVRRAQRARRPADGARRQAAAPRSVRRGQEGGGGGGEGGGGGGGGGRRRRRPRSRRRRARPAARARRRRPTRRGRSAIPRSSRSRRPARAEAGPPRTARPARRARTSAPMASRGGWSTRPTACR